MIDREKFLFCYTNEYGELKPSQRDGLMFILNCLNNDEKMQDVRWQSYALSTIKHECAGTWRPIEEYGKGKGMKYGKIDSVTAKGYWGRGYCQLTWKENYRTMGKSLGYDLEHHPEIALQPAVAYQILSRGMRLGMFTGVGLSRYLHGEVTDYVNARKIINGTDCAEKIAGYAVAIEKLLRESEIREVA